MNSDIHSNSDIPSDEILAKLGKAWPHRAAEGKMRYVVVGSWESSLPYYQHLEVEGKEARNHPSVIVILSASGDDIASVLGEDSESGYIVLLSVPRELPIKISYGNKKWRKTFPKRCNMYLVNDAQTNYIEYARVVKAIAAAPNNTKKVINFPA